MGRQTAALAGWTWDEGSMARHPPVRHRMALAPTCSQGLRNPGPMALTVARQLRDSRNPLWQPPC